MRAQRLLAVFAHPDDETLLAGGTLAASAARGVEVSVISASAEGERAAELQAACRVLGVTAAESLDLPDGSLEDCREQLDAGVQAVLARRDPDVVITFGPEGLYWHPDHIAVHESVVAAANGRPVSFATMPEGHLSDLIAELGARGLPTDVWGLEPAAFGAPPESIDERRDVRSFLDAKLRALKAHGSQFAEGHALRALPQDLAERYLGWEFFAGAAP